MNRDRDEGGQGERLMQRPGVAAEAFSRGSATADQQTGADRGAGEDQRRDPRRPAGDPEEVRADGGRGRRDHDAEVMTGAGSGAGARLGAASSLGADSSLGVPSSLGVATSFGVASSSGAASFAARFFAGQDRRRDRRAFTTGAMSRVRAPVRRGEQLGGVDAAEGRVVAGHELAEDDRPGDREQRQRPAKRAPPDQLDATSLRPDLGAGKPLCLEAVEIVHRPHTGFDSLSGRKYRLRKLLARQPTN